MPARTTTAAPAPGPATPAQASLYQQLRGHLAELKLHDAAGALPAVLDTAAAEGLTLTAALEQLLAIEVSARRLAGRLRFASLPSPATLEDFDYDAAPAIDPHLIAELATCRYLENATNVLLIGPTEQATDCNIFVRCCRARCGLSRRRIRCRGGWWRPGRSSG